MLVPFPGMVAVRIGREAVRPKEDSDVDEICMGMVLLHICGDWLGMCPVRNA